MLLFIFLLTLFIYSNSRLAGKKGKNPFLWGFITFIAFFVTYCLLGTFYLLVIYNGVMTQDALTAYLKEQPMVVLALTMFGVGGALLVRFILERVTKSDEVS